MIVRKELTPWQRKTLTTRVVFLSGRIGSCSETSGNVHRKRIQKGLNHLIYEIVDNAVDEHLAGYCSDIEVTLEKDGSCTVTDNGRGIPVDMHAKGVSAERLVFTTLHAGGKFDNSAYKTSGGLHALVLPL